jgi:phosphatidylglycerophosphatase A
MSARSNPAASTTSPVTDARGALPPPSLGKPVHLLAFGLGTGCSPRAPGTMGTLLAVALYLPLSLLPLWAYLAVVAAVIAFGVWLCGRASRDLGVHDHPGIVWDEIAGFLLAMTAAPPGLLWVLVGFALFRLFDIWKPWPIGWLDQRIGGGLGIMLDDVVAGLFALACLQVAAAVW